MNSSDPPSYTADTNMNTKQQDQYYESSPGTQASPQAHDPKGKRPSLYERICHNKAFQSTCRVMQCLSCIVSLILFALRLHRLAQHVIDTVTASNGAVMGILAAAVLYTISGMIIRSALKNGGPMYLRFVWVILDMAFVIAFIMVAELTAPGRDMTSGPCHTALNPKTVQGTVVDIYNESNCQLPLGTFILAIFST